MLFDTHAHLNDARFDEDRDTIIQNCLSQNVGLILNIGCCLKSSRESIELAKKYPQIYATVGVHPHDAKELNEAELNNLRALAGEDKVCAIGEIGLDYYYDNSPRDVQRYWFERQLAFAVEANMPVVIHNRDAHKDCLDILRKFDLSKNSGTLHCFSGSVEIAREILKMGLYISVGGALTFKNANRINDVVREVPLERLLIETDCPYLSPEPFRGKRNDPSKTIYVAQKIAEIKGMDVDDVVKQTMKNGCELFKIKAPI